MPPPSLDKFEADVHSYDGCSKPETHIFVKIDIGAKNAQKIDSAHKNLSKFSIMSIIGQIRVWRQNECESDFISILIKSWGWRQNRD